jgi:hypothetical protein
LQSALAFISLYPESLNALNAEIDGILAHVEHELTPTLINVLKEAKRVCVTSGLVLAFGQCAKLTCCRRCVFSG